jgi:hypothetical protein
MENPHPQPIYTNSLTSPASPDHFTWLNVTHRIYRLTSYSYRGVKLEYLAVCLPEVLA